MAARKVATALASSRREPSMISFDHLRSHQGNVRRMRTPIIVMAALTFALAAVPVVAADGAYSPEPSKDPNVPACQIFSGEEISAALNGSAEVRESYGTDTTVGLCSWQNSAHDAFVKVSYFPPGSQGLPEGKERESFEFYARNKQNQFEPGQFAPVADIGDAAWSLNIKDNEEAYYSVEFVKGSTTVTIDTNGIGLDATVQLAKAAAARL